jgi:hypothetical protein
MTKNNTALNAASPGHHPTPPGTYDLQVDTSVSDPIECALQIKEALRDIHCAGAFDRLRARFEGGRSERPTLTWGLYLNAEANPTPQRVDIPADSLELVFERLYQVREEGDTRQGSGLGLAISKEFVELMGGKIWVESEIGEGSVFAFVVSET